MLKRFFSAVLLAAASTGAFAEARIEQAWLRAVPPVSPSMAGYFVLVNDTDQPLVLTGASAEFAGMAMLHDTSTDGEGRRSMSHLKEVTIPAGESLAFTPGGRHLMLMKMDPVPEAGETPKVCLAFQNHADLCGAFQVRHNEP
ncbi:copper chaperone PCu(A)C [Alloalcanivorax xenomutans]|uniref:copper chaperone PCu(A)C n=1 Tax=Alloalcanivorax xenomutans TaxID=1094342 RepID=UPI003A7F6B83